MQSIKYVLLALNCLLLVFCSNPNDDNTPTPPDEESTKPIGEEPVKPIDDKGGYEFKEPTTNNVFYIDPVNGKADGDGSINNPWKTLEEVINGKRIQYYQIKDGKRTLVNKNAPVKGGDKLILKSGYHGVIEFNNGFSFDNWLTIEGEKGASISKFHIKNIYSNIYLKNLTVCNKLDASWKSWYKGRFSETENNYMVLFAAKKQYDKRENIKLYNLTVTSSKGNTNVAEWNIEDWKKVCSGIKLSSAKNYEVVNCKITNTSFALRTDTANNDKEFQGKKGVFYNNTVENFTGDALHIATSDVRVENNKLIGAIKTNDNHDDIIQLLGKYVGSIKDITIRNNDLIAHGKIKDMLAPEHKSCQGIGAFDGFYENFVIENNVVITNHYHGITIFGGKNCKIINNTIVDEFDGDKSSPWIQVNNHKDGRRSSDILIANNIVSYKVSLEGGTNNIASIKVTNNHVLKRNFSLLNQLFIDHTRDFQLKNNAYTKENIIDKGVHINNAFSSEYDKNYRYRGLVPSIGAFENQ